MLAWLWLRGVTVEEWKIVQSEDKVYRILRKNLFLSFFRPSPAVQCSAHTSWETDRLCTAAFARKRKVHSEIGSWRWFFLLVFLPPEVYFFISFSSFLLFLFSLSYSTVRPTLCSTLTGKQLDCALLHQQRVRLQRGRKQAGGRPVVSQIREKWPPLKWSSASLKISI